MHSIEVSFQAIECCEVGRNIGRELRNFLIVEREHLCAHLKYINGIWKKWIRGDFPLPRKVGRSRIVGNIAGGLSLSRVLPRPGHMFYPWKVAKRRGITMAEWSKALYILKAVIASLYLPGNIRKLGRYFGTISTN